MTRPALVVTGGSGLLGSAVLRAAARAGLPARAAPIPWQDPALAARAAGDLVRGCAVGGIDLVWCAGRGVTSSPAEDFVADREAFAAALEALATLPAQSRAASTVCLASSAGAVYAGTDDNPHTESTPTRALVPYGEAKLALEHLLADGVRAAGSHGVAARITNLYGPGQDLAKGQGLVSIVLSRALAGEPVSILMPLDTTRDYVFVDDAAAMLLACLDRAAREPAGTMTVKIVGSGVASTISDVLDAAERALGHPVAIQTSAGDRPAGQAVRCAVVSEVWPDVSALATTPLVDGIAATLADLRRRGADIRR